MSKPKEKKGDKKIQDYLVELGAVKALLNLPSKRTR